jgi:UDP-N-acetylglucosamine:LPS N-acetylglucosamine transferase
LSQLLLLEDGWKDCDTFCITTQAVVRQKLAKYGNVYVVAECNRQQPLRVAKALLSCAKAVFREKPDVVITTGAAVGCIVCFLAKVIGAKVVWIDSIANVERLSLSGRMVRYVADLFLVQWPELAQKYSNVQYIGSII